MARRSTRQFGEDFKRKTDQEFPLLDRQDMPDTAIDREITSLGAIDAILDALTGLQVDPATNQAFHNAVGSLRNTRERMGSMARTINTNQEKGKMDLNWKSDITPPNFGNATALSVRPKDAGIVISDGSNIGFSLWIERINRTCNGVTMKVWLDTLANHAAGRLLESITHFQRIYEQEGHLDPLELINRCELSFGPALNANHAAELLRNIRLRQGEDILALECRIKNLAAVAVREHEEDEKKAARERISCEALIHALPEPLKSEVQRTIRDRARNGRMRFSFTELSRECHRLSTIGGFHLRTGAIRTLNESDEDYVSQVRPAMREVTRSHGSFFRKSEPQVPAVPSGSKLQVIDYSCDDETSEEGANVSADDSILDQDELDGIIYFIKDKQGKRRRLFSGDLGVGRDECLKCASKGHRYRGPGSQNCPYYKDPILPKCSKCGRGGHNPLKCLRGN